MNISIFTATGHYNLGDELILMQEYKILSDYFGENTIFNIFTYDEKSSILEQNKNINYISYFPKDIRKKPFLNIKYFFKNIYTIIKSEIIIVGGGGLIYDNELEKSNFTIILRKIRIFLAKFFRKKIFYFAIGIDVKDPKKIKYLFSGKKVFVSVRDKKSSEILDKIGIKNQILNDPVFSYEPILKNNKDSKKIIGISLRKGYLKNELDNIKQLILFLSKKGYKIIFLSNSIHKYDEIANDYLFLKDFSRKYNIEITKNIKDTLRTYSSIDFIIGMRLHSIILSFIFNIPFFALIYGKKTEELIKSLKYEHFLYSSSFDFENFVNKFEFFEKNNSKIDFKPEINIIKKDLKNNINNFLKNGLE